MMAAMMAANAQQAQQHGAQPGVGSGPAAWLSGLANTPAGLGHLLKDDFSRGLVVGAAATFLLTNPKVQERGIAALVQLWDLLQGGVSEIKERFHDAEAEIHRDGPTEPAPDEPKG